VKISKNNAWSLDFGWQTVGCHTANNDIAIYERVPSKLDKKEPKETSVVFTHFLARVRSGNDPLVHARELTEGRLDFGLTAGDWKAMGFVLFLVSLCLVIQPLAFFKRRVAGESVESPRLVEFTNIRSSS